MQSPKLLLFFDCHADTKRFSFFVFQRALESYVSMPYFTFFKVLRTTGLVKEIGTKSLNIRKLMVGRMAQISSLWIHNLIGYS